MSNDASPVAHPTALHPVLHPDICDGFHLLEADAGTGKTWTIARLVVRALIESKLSIDRIAVLTFTNAAAAELNQRIGLLLEQCLNEPVGKLKALADDLFFQAKGADYLNDEARRLLRIARLQLDEAPITTIHGFCQRLLDDNALSLGRWDRPQLEPDDIEPINEAIAAWWRREIIDGGDEIPVLLGKNGLSFDGLRQVLTSAIASPDAIIDSPQDISLTALAQQLHRCVGELREQWQQEGDAITEWLTMPKELSGTYFKVEQIHDLLAPFDAWLAQFPDGADTPAAALGLLDYRRVKKGLVKKTAHRENLERYKTFRLAQSLNDLLFARLNIAMIVAAQIRSDVAARAQQMRRQKQTISFDDLLDETLRALRDPVGGAQLANRLRAQFPLAFVDEFQDTDPMQWEIFRRIYLETPRTGPGGLILVGDPKQAIYSFRNADVFTYLAAREQQAIRHRLDQNQRAGQAMIDAVNASHARPEPFGMAQIPFGTVRPGRMAQAAEAQAPTDGRAALVLVMLGDKQAPAAGIKAETARERAATTCAAQIADLLAKGQARAADIAVLVRSGAQGTSIKRALVRRGIGAVEVSRDSVFASQDARDLQRIIQAIAAPSDNALVRGALTTTVVGLTLVQLEQASQDAQQWLQLLQAFHDSERRWHRYGAQAALRRLILTDLKLAAPMAMSPSGERRLTNLLHLLKLIGEDPGAAQGAAQAAHWLAQQIKLTRLQRRGNEATQMRLESDDTLVRILTIHISKGLEFPIVFMPFNWASSGANQPAAQTVHRDGQRMLVQYRKPAGWPSQFDILVPKNTLSAQFALESFQEAMRLNYVAMTRAVRRCYFFWATPGTKAQAQSAPLPAAYLFDSAATGPCPDAAESARAPDYDVVHNNMVALAETNNAVTCWHWQELCDEVSGATPAARPARQADVDGADEIVLSEDARGVQTAWVNRSFTSLAQQLDTHASTPVPSFAAGNDPNRPDHDELQATALIERPVERPIERLSQRPIGSSIESQFEKLVEPPLDHNATDQHDAPTIASQFARGALAGTCLHTILENTDFVQGVQAEVVERELRRSGLAVAERMVPSPQVAQWLNRVLDTRLPASVNPGEPGFRLNQLARSDRICELAYTLAVSKMDMSALTDAVRGEFALNGQLPGPAWSGFLNGYIDLIVRVNGRYWLLDWKSNWLAPAAADYTNDLLAAAMTEHAYHLQLCLYCLALHRLLRSRLPAYDYDTHIGGAHYLFLRGMTGGDAPTGVYTVRPSRELIEQLDQIAGA